MKLSQKAIADAKPREKRFKLHDGGGLFVLVLALRPQNILSASRRWSDVRLGRFPEMSLKDARLAGINGTI